MTKQDGELIEDIGRFLHGLDSFNKDPFREVLARLRKRLGEDVPAENWVVGTNDRIVEETRGRQRHWAVTVSRDGTDILTIGSNFLAGLDLGVEDQQCIRDCAQHLLAFVGEAKV